MKENVEIGFIRKDGKVYVNASYMENNRTRFVSGKISKPEVQHLLDEVTGYDFLRAAGDID